MIHVWSPKTYLNVAFVRASHCGPVLSMAFTSGDEVLVTVGSTRPAPLVLYCWAQKTVMASTVLNELPLEIQARHIEEDNVTVIVTQTKIYEMTIVDSLTHFEEFCNVANHRTELKQEALTAGAVIRTNESMPKLSYRVTTLGLTGHSDGTLVYWNEGKSPVIAANYQAQITCIKPAADYFAIATATGCVFLVRLL